MLTFALLISIKVISIKNVNVGDNIGMWRWWIISSFRKRVVPSTSRPGKKPIGIPIKEMVICNATYAAVTRWCVLFVLGNCELRGSSPLMLVKRMFLLPKERQN